MTYAQPVVASQVTALIIQPDNSFRVQQIEQPSSLHMDRVHTQYADMWTAENAEDCPFNRAATYLLWKLEPDLEGSTALHGPVYVTGRDNEDAFSDPVPGNIIELLMRITDILDEEVNEDPNP